MAGDAPSKRNGWAELCTSDYMSDGPVRKGGDPRLGRMRSRDVRTGLDQRGQHNEPQDGRSHRAKPASLTSPSVLFDEVGDQQFSAHDLSGYSMHCLDIRPSVPVHPTDSAKL